MRCCYSQVLELWIGLSVPTLKLLNYGVKCSVAAVKFSNYKWLKMQFCYSQDLKLGVGGSAATLKSSNISTLPMLVLAIETNKNSDGLFGKYVE